jgi:hypothetical protein
MANVLQQFQVGQKVCIKEHGSACYISVLPDDQAGPVVAEVASEFIVFDDDAAGVRRRIPVYLIRIGEVPLEPVSTAA